METSKSSQPNSADEKTHDLPSKLSKNTVEDVATLSGQVEDLTQATEALRLAKHSSVGGPKKVQLTAKQQSVFAPKKNRKPSLARPSPATTTPMANTAKCVNCESSLDRNSADGLCKGCKFGRCRTRDCLKPLDADDTDKHGQWKMKCKACSLPKCTNCDNPVTTLSTTGQCDACDMKQLKAAAGVKKQTTLEPDAWKNNRLKDQNTLHDGYKFDELSVSAGLPKNFVFKFEAKAKCAHCEHEFEKLRDGLCEECQEQKDEEERLGGKRARVGIAGLIGGGLEKIEEKAETEGKTEEKAPAAAEKRNEMGMAEEAPNKQESNDSSGGMKGSQAASTKIDDQQTPAQEHDVADKH